MEKKHRRIVGLRTENVLKLGVVAIDPDPHWNGIGGPNDSGKSSLLTSIKAALGGAKFTPAEPVRKGQKRAETVIDLGDMEVTWTCTDTGSPRLTVSNKDGAVFKSPATMLEGLIDRYGFDLAAFINADPWKQRELYREALGVDLTGFDREHDQAYEERRDVNREVRRIQGAIDSMDVSADVPDEPVSTDDLLKQLAVWDRYDAAVDIREAHKEEAERIEERIQEAAQRIIDLENNIKIERDRIEALEHKKGKELEAAKKPMKAPPETTRNEIQEAIRNAESVNEAIRNNEVGAKLQNQVAEMESRSTELSKQLTEIEERKAKTIAEAEGAVEGLAFDESGLRYNDVPLEQASSRQRFEVALAVGRARNPDMSIVFIEQGAFFDAESRKTLRDLAVENDLQIWFECVDDNESVTVLMEEGEVKESR